MALKHVLVGDIDRLRRVLGKLTAHAFQFTDSGLVSISAEIECETDAYVQLMFRVMDSGPGFRPELIGRIFDGFVHIEAPGSNRQGGLGLGLATCGSLVESMGGQIGLNS